jgi:hypothetical protein
MCCQCGAGINWNSWRTWNSGRDDDDVSASEGFLETIVIWEVSGDFLVRK